MSYNMFYLYLSTLDLIKDPQFLIVNLMCKFEQFRAHPRPLAKTSSRVCRQLRALTMPCD